VRLANVSRGHRFKHRMILRMIRIMAKMEPADVLKTIFYRPEFFGSHFSALTQSVLRGPSEWTVGERELFASFTSHRNQCVF
jgi:hypothetical protein